MLGRVTEKLLPDVPERLTRKLPTGVTLKHKKAACCSATKIPWRVRTSRNPAIFWQSCTTGARKKSLLKPRRQASFSYSVLPVMPIYKFNIMPTGKGEIFTGLFRKVISGMVVFLQFQKLYPTKVTENSFRAGKTAR